MYTVQGHVCCICMYVDVMVCVCQTLIKKLLYFTLLYLDREFEFYEFFSFLKFNEFYEFFLVEKNSQNIRNFANHRCLTCFDVLECNVHL